jgi:archaellum biogenesis protein FlaJ (TadC family)
MIAYRIVPFLLAGLVAAKDHGKVSPNGLAACLETYTHH